ncbi:hypothetical protein Axi01nite_57980 [Actinoplanes xinjiangensis]|nr:hypothetical protein Axi01nite_57980 [Actinoplanes xinjiangensis]
MIVSAELPPLPARLRLIAWCTAPVLPAALGSLLAWPGWAVALVIVLVAFLVGILRSTPANGRKSAAKPGWRRLLGLVLYTAVFVCTVATFHAARLTVLDLAGRPTTVEVDYVETNQRTFRGGRTDTYYCFHLRRPDGSPVTGSICRDGRDYSRGVPLQVLAEPTGLVAPETPDAVARAVLPRSIALGAFVVICLAALSGGGPAGPQRPPVPPGRYGRWRPSPPRPRRTRGSRPRKGGRR